MPLRVYPTQLSANVDNPIPPTPFQKCGVCGHLNLELETETLPSVVCRYFGGTAIVQHYAQKGKKFATCQPCLYLCFCIMLAVVSRLNISAFQLVQRRRNNQQTNEYIVYFACSLQQSVIYIHTTDCIEKNMQPGEREPFSNREGVRSDTSSFVM